MTELTESEKDAVVEKAARLSQKMLKVLNGARADEAQTALSILMAECAWRIYHLEQQGAERMLGGLYMASMSNYQLAVKDAGRLQ